MHILIQILAIEKSTGAGEQKLLRHWNYNKSIKYQSININLTDNIRRFRELHTSKLGTHVGPGQRYSFPGHLGVFKQVLWGESEHLPSVDKSRGPVVAAFFRIRFVGVVKEQIGGVWNYDLLEKEY